MVKIKFIAQGSNTAIGGFSSGDIANVGEALAKHLVEEARVAQYVPGVAKEQPKPADEPVETGKKAGGKKK